MTKRAVLSVVFCVLGLAHVCQAQHGYNDPTVAGGAHYGAACPADRCNTPLWTGYGEFLLLRPSNAKVSYAVPINGAIVPPAGVAPVQVGREALLDIGYNAGFRGGFGRALSECSSIGVAYTHFDSVVTGSFALDAPPPDIVLRSLINHPGTTAAPTDFLEAAGRYRIDFRLADIEYRGLMSCGPQHTISGVVGIRYGHLEQTLVSEFRNATTEEFVGSDISFEGGGVRLGLEAEQHAACSGFYGYGKTYASFLAGRFSGTYVQTDSFRDPLVLAGWTEDRVVPVLELEVGIGWASACDRVRFSAGYMYAAWLNTLTTDEFIQSVQTNDSVSVRDTLAFDGLVLRTEIRY